MQFNDYTITYLYVNIQLFKLDNYEISPHNQGKHLIPTPTFWEFK